MEPTLHSNNFLVTERISRRFDLLQRGNIIVCKCPTKPQQHICKRIVGLPGDTVYIKPRYNWNPFDTAKSIVTTEIEEALDDRTNQLNSDELRMRNFLGKSVLVPRGHVWVEGDNVENSTDSRTYGPIPMGLIQSRILIRLWPFNEIRLFV